MTVRRIADRPAKYSSEAMDTAADKEERKREYNRLAQREFRRRRKEHLKNLEDAQRAQSSEQTEEIERLRAINAELKRENEALRSQLYGSSSASTSSQLLMPSVMTVPHHHHSTSPAHPQPSSNDASRAYSMSPSITSNVDPISSPNTPPAAISSDMLPLNPQMALTSSMLLATMPAYAEPPNAMANLAAHPYSMVDASGIQHNAQGSRDSSGFPSARPAVGTAFQQLNLPARAENPQGRVADVRPASPIIISPYDKNRARLEAHALFAPLLNDARILTDPAKHLSTLQSMASHLPPSLKPTPLQLATPHYFGIDVIPSRALREQLLGVDSDLAQSFLADLSIVGNGQRDVGQLIIWGGDPFDEHTWEFSQSMLERWNWLIGREWTTRANFWRRQRGAQLLPEW